MRTLQKPSPRAVLLQIIKQLICTGMVIIVILPILLTLFAANCTRPAGRSHPKIQRSWRETAGRYTAA